VDALVRNFSLLNNLTKTLIGPVNFLVSESLGRRKPIFFSMIVIIIGAAIQASSFHQAQLFVGRVVTGFGTGIET
jgi:MFS family permease